jgi:hypothetical protein
MKIDPEFYTYEKRLGQLNFQKVKACKGPFKGIVTKYLTKNGLPIIWPDQWMEYSDATEGVVRIPDDVTAYKLGS